MVLGFRTKKDGTIYPVSGISSTSIIGAPVSKSQTEKNGEVSVSIGAATRSKLRPLDFAGQNPAKAGSDKYQVDRVLHASKEKLNAYRNAMAEVERHGKAKDFETATDLAEPVRKEEVKERTGEIRQLREILKDIPIGRSKKDREKNKEFRDDLQKTIEESQRDRLLVERMNWGSSEQALKFAWLNKGDEVAGKMLEAIRKGKFKKARKLAEERSKANAKIIAENTRLASSEADNIFKLAGYRQNAQGQYIPTDETPEIAKENLGFDISQEELAELSRQSYQAPPKLDPDEILVLASTTEGEGRLRKWGYIK